MSIRIYCLFVCLFMVMTLFLNLLSEAESRGVLGRTVLHQAVVDRDNGAVAQLISEGIDVNRVDNFQWTALHHAVTSNNLSAIDQLLAAHADLTMQTKRGETPLHMAAGLGYVAVVQKLIAAGADLKRVDENGDTPLHIAAEWGWPSVAALLLQAGADVHVKNKSGMTPLDIASDFEARLHVDGRKEVANIFMHSAQGNRQQSFMDIAREHRALVAGIITAMMTIVMALIHCAHHPQAAALGAVAAVVNQQPLDRLMRAGVAVPTPLVQVALKKQ